jgi:UDP-N-acetylglucosamine 4,6-dehydratase/5-epimerase
MKIVLITGGTGSWGNELTTQLLKIEAIEEIRIFSRGESKQVEMRRYFNNSKLKFIIGDVRDRDRLKYASYNVDTIFHLAALKHVPICEDNPWEAVLTNVVGTQNLIDVSIENKVSQVIDISTDKAVDPYNLYGITKACGEKLIIAGNLLSGDTKFSCVRGGNIIGSSGSVVPLFKEQILRSSEITITDKNMTRFLIRVQEAIELVLHATTQAVGGEVFVLKMPHCRIIDLARVMMNRLSKEERTIKYIGKRPGEKMHEVLVSRYETNRTVENERFYIILPEIDLQETREYYINKAHNKIDIKEYSSDSPNAMGMQEIEDIIDIDGWFNEKKYEEYLKNMTEKDLVNIFEKEGWFSNYNNAK